jgi:short-chain fatty acids transporter
MVQFISNLFEKYLPSSLSIAIGLNLIVGLCVLLFVDVPFAEILTTWQSGVFNLLAFSMQMTLIFVCGYTIAQSQLIKKWLISVVDVLQTPVKALVGVFVIASAASLLNWGFGLVVGAILAREIGERNAKVHYPLVVAAAYSGFIFWHGGLSGSIPLTLAGGGESLAKTTNDLLTEAIPISQTLFTLQNSAAVVGLLIIMAALIRWMHRSYERNPKTLVSIANGSKKGEHQLDDVQEVADISLVHKAENHPAFTKIIGLSFLATYTFISWQSAFSVGLNDVIFISLGIAFLVHERRLQFLASFQEGLKRCSGIVLQFPLYAGIMALVALTDSTNFSLANAIVDFFLDFASTDSLPVFAFLSAGILNVLVPSGGGQWAIQAPIFIEASLQLNTDIPKVAMAIAWGDAWTNLIQPFWAIPLLAIAKLDAKSIMGFCFLLLILSGLYLLGIFYSL